MTDYSKFLEEKLREAASVGDIETVESLISSGVNVNSQNGVNGWSALHWAAYRNHIDIVNILLKHGATKKSLTKDGKSPSQLSSNPEIQILLGGVPCAFQEKALPIVPNYLANPPLYLPSSLIPTISKPIGIFNKEKPLKDLASTENDEELVLKVRVAGSKEPDFIEIEIPRSELSFRKLVETCCMELNVESSTVIKLRKLPDTIIRKDKDVLRLVDFQEVEIVLPKETNSGKNSVLNSSVSKYESISSNQNQTVLY